MEYINYPEVKPPVYSKQKNQSNTQTKTTPVRTKKGHRSGVTLVEVVLSVVIMIISLLGISTAYVSARGQITKQRYYQAAVHLASQKIEEIRAAGYSSIELEEDEESRETNEELALSGLTFLRNTLIEPTAEPTGEVPNPCIKATVSVQWTGAAGDQHEVELLTYIGP